MKSWNIFITFTALLFLFSCSDDELLEKFENGNYIPMSEDMSFSFTPDPSSISANLSKATGDSTVTYKDTTKIYVIGSDSVTIYENWKDSTTVKVVANEKVLGKGVLGLKTDSLVAVELDSIMILMSKQLEPAIAQHYESIGGINALGIEDSLHTMTISTVGATVEGSLLTVSYTITAKGVITVPLNDNNTPVVINGDFSMDVVHKYQTIVGTIPPTTWPAIK